MKTKMKMKVAAYYRMSSDDQKASIGQQRKEVRAYATEHGYEIVREYLEEGKSGSKDQEKRVQFERMLVDAAKHEFKAVLCWNTSRFARLDSIDGSLAKRVLRTNGVHLETVKEGKIDWNTFEGRILDVLLAESDHKFSRDISALTLRGRLDVLRRGFWPNGSIPYGYDRLYVDGDKTHLVERKSLFRKPRNWQLKLAVNDAEAEAVAWLFDQFATRDTSLRQLSMELSKRGIASPGNGRGGWTKDAVKQVLSNRAYVGIGQIGHGRRRQKEAFNRAEPTENEGSCPIIVERAVFDAVQKKLELKRASGRKPHGNRSSALTGCLYCGHCGYSLDKKSRKGRTYFTCSSAVRRPKMKCHQWRVHESDMLPLVTNILVEELDYELLKSLQSKPTVEIGGDVDGMRKRCDALKKKLDRGTERYLSASDAIMADLEAKLIEWKRELAEVEATIRLEEIAQIDGERSSFSAWLEKVKGRLITVSEIEWGNQQSMRQPINLSASERKAIEKSIGGKVGKCRASWSGNPDSGFTMTLGEGSMVELDADGQEWLWVEYEFPLRPAIMSEIDTLRELLHQLNVKITLFWKPANGRYFTLDRRRLQAEINQHLVAEHTGTLRRKVPALKIERFF